MKVLFLNHPEADYGEYFLYNGLCDILGAENVWDFPYKKSYHGEVHVYDRPWAGGASGCTAPFEFANARQSNVRTEQDVLDALRSDSFDLIVVGSPRYEAARNLRRLHPEMRTPRIVLHDGEDYGDVDYFGLTKECQIRLVLKRELAPGAFGPRGVEVRPFPFSCPIHGDQDQVAKEVDVLCAVGDSNPVRGAAKAVVASLPSSKVLCGHWGWSRYIELIAQSKIAVAPHGHGQDTVRRWEIPAFDTLLVCERLILVEKNPLRDGEHCVYYSGADDLRDKLTWWLQHDAERERIAQAGQAFVHEHHTNAARARQMLEWVREVYG